MNRKRIWGWWFFDWASQPFATLLLTFIFSIYFGEVAKTHFIAMGESATIAGAQAQTLWGTGLTISGLLIAIFAPILGAVADTTGRRMLWIWIFSAFYVFGSAGLWFLAPQQPGLVVALIYFGIGMIGMEFATIFTNALLPALAPQDQIGRISGSGYAFGYAGGLVSLVFMLLLFAENPRTGLTLIGIPPIFGLDPALREGTRFAGPFTAIWYIIFMIPFFLWVKEPRLPKKPFSLGHTLSDLWRLIASLGQRQSLAAWLLSSMFSRDALNAMYAFGGIYAGTVLGWPVFLSGVFGVVSALAAAIISQLAGGADQRYGPKPVIIVSTWALIGVCMVIVGMDRSTLFGMALSPESRIPDAIFFACGVVIGGAGGALQSAGRTLMVRHTTPEKATEAFGLFALSGKATAFLAPFLIATVTAISGSQRIGISPLIVIFLLSLVLLHWVKAEGEAEQ